MLLSLSVNVPLNVEVENIKIGAKSLIWPRKWFENWFYSLLKTYFKNPLNTWNALKSKCSKISQASQAKLKLLSDLNADSSINRREFKNRWKTKSSMINIEWLFDQRIIVITQPSDNIMKPAQATVFMAEESKW